MAETEWRCDDCGCRTFARVDERKSDGSFGPGPQVRCVNCKAVTDLPVSKPPHQEEGGADWARRDQMRLDHIKKLERRIHNQRRSNRDNWEIVESRQRWLGSKAARDAHGRLLKTYRSISAKLKDAEAQIEALRKERDEALLCQQQIAAGSAQSATVARIIIAKNEADGRAEAAETKLAEAIKVIEPFAIDLSSLSSKGFLQILICPEDDDAEGNFTPHFHAARSFLDANGGGQ